MAGDDPPARKEKKGGGWAIAVHVVIERMTGNQGTSERDTGSNFAKQVEANLSSNKALVDLYQRAIADPTNSGVRF